MNIRCPHCGFAKEIPDQAIPADAVRVNCPQCNQSFPLERAANQPELTFAPNDEAPAVVCPSCKLAQPKAAHCSRCGMALAVLAPQAAVSPYAGFWLRVVASIIDSLVVTLIQVIGGLIFGVAGGLISGGFSAEENGIFGIVWLFTTVIGLAYYVVFTGACGQTLGKMALRIKVIRTDGSDIGYPRALLREVLGKFVSGLILGIGYLMVAFDERKQGLHDKIADSLVVKL